MMEGVWTGCSERVGSFSWSPSGGHLASGFHNGTILIHTTESGQVEVGPIETKQRVVYSLAYSPLEKHHLHPGLSRLASCLSALWKTWDMV